MDVFCTPYTKERALSHTLAHPLARVTSKISLPYPHMQNNATRIEPKLGCESNAERHFGFVEILARFNLLLQDLDGRIGSITTL